MARMEQPRCDDCSAAEKLNALFYESTPTTSAAEGQTPVIPGSSQLTARSNSHHGERSGRGHSKSTPKLYGVTGGLFK